MERGENSGDFHPVDANAILRIPLRMQDGEDWWAWELEKHGEFSVKTVYRKLASMHQQAIETPETSGDEFWKKTWKLNVPPKVKVFWWRVLHEFLPAKSELNRWHIEPTVFCETCGADSESIRHVLLECTIARMFWRELKSITGAKIPDLNSYSWATDILLDGFSSDNERRIFIIGMYSLWMQRNKRRHGEDQIPVRTAVSWTVDLANDLWEIHKPKKKQVLSASNPTWRPPSDGWVKCNNDAAYQVGIGQGATGVIVRDSAGQFMGGRAPWYPRWRCWHAEMVCFLRRRRRWTSSKWRRITRSWLNYGQEVTTIAQVWRQFSGR
ncbi:unnamed protein product [Miscanthus lutarioriparius]|uniref:Reverse transcriptase zinc-binding domain-containing protein n=1 Tax=Miscanthus lutarioriparius TaxID=422564 RepID=A0A811RDN0_9POAL|nr:unnamed protein product [Miscanthus lutarioriparius]